MSIIRSNIARQLLAEGGAPRKGFARGSGRGRTDADTMTGSGYTSSFDDGFGGGDEFARPTYSEQYAAMNVPDAVSKGGDNEPGFFQKGIDRLSSYTPLSLLNKFDQKFLKPGRDKYNLSRRTDFLRKQGLIGPGEEDEKYTDEFLTSPEGLDMLKGMGYTTIQDIIDKGRGEGGDSEIIKKLRAPITEKIEEPKGEFDDMLKFYGARFEDGGEVRQNYGLGSIVKKAVGAVKKVAKSPIGKAALFAGLGAYGLGAGPFSSGKFGAGFLKSDAFKKLLLKKGKDEFTFGNLSPLSLISIPTAASYLFSKKDEEEEELPTVSNTDPEFQKYLAFYGGPRRFAEGGGDIDEAPIKMASHEGNTQLLEQLYEDFLDLGFSPEDAARKAQEAFDDMTMKQNMPKQDIKRAMAAGGGMMNPNDEMLNLGGDEMDLRGGGFVPLGEYEKKDDVPARLSKNEFVFTADAVRAAGGGSVDRGADIMYKTMKNLENKIA